MAVSNQATRLISAPYMHHIQATPQNVKKFRDSILDQDTEYEDPVPILRLQQDGELIPFLTRKSISVWQGKAKSKKTLALTMVVAECIKEDRSDDSLFVSCAEGSIVYCDTEQGESYGAKTMKLILEQAGLPRSKNLIYLELRSCQPCERLQIIHAALDTIKNVKLLVIDGMVDLMDDFMVAGEGHQVITRILALSSEYDVHIAGVLHQNKNDKNPRAHIGSIASQKCEIEISVDVDVADPAQSIVTCVKSRGLPFKPFAVRREKDALPEVNQHWNLPPSSKLPIDQHALAKSLFKEGQRYSYSDVIERFMGKTPPCSESTAKRFLKGCIDTGVVLKSPDGGYRLNSPEEKTESSLEKVQKIALLGVQVHPLYGVNMTPVITVLDSN